MAAVAGVGTAGITAAQGAGSGGSDAGGSNSGTSQSTAAAQLTAREGDPVTRDFGEDRGAQTVVLFYDADHALTSPPSASAGDAHTDKGRPFHGTVSASAELVGGSAVRVPVVLDPADDVRPDSYTIPIALRGPEIDRADGSLVVKLSRAPALFWAWMLAILALGLGIVAGGLLKWLSDTGSKLHDLLAINERIASQLLGAGPLPAQFENDLGAARQQLRDGDTAGADTAFKALSDGVPKLLPALRPVNAVGESLASQEESIAAMGADLDTTTLLRVGVFHERTSLAALRDRLWPDPGAVGDDLTTLKGTVAGFTAFLAAHQTSKSREGQDFQDAVERYARGQFDDPARVREAQRADDPTGAPPRGEGDGLPKTSLGRGALWLAARSPFVIGVLTAVGLALVGLATVFKPNTMFLTNDGNDFLLLVLWGFGAALTGITVTDLAGKATGAGTPK